MIDRVDGHVGAHTNRKAAGGHVAGLCAICSSQPAITYEIHRVQHRYGRSLNHPPLVVRTQSSPMRCLRTDESYKYSTEADDSIQRTSSTQSRLVVSAGNVSALFMDATDEDRLEVDASFPQIRPCRFPVCSLLL